MGTFCLRNVSHLSKITLWILGLCVISIKLCQGPYSSYVFCYLFALTNVQCEVNFVQTFRFNSEAIMCPTLYSIVRQLYYPDSC